MITDKTLNGISAFMHKVKADEIWKDMNASEKHGVRFGLFPARIQETEKEGFDGHKLVCALMDCAKADGGMIG